MVVGPIKINWQIKTLPVFNLIAVLCWIVLIVPSPMVFVCGCLIQAPIIMIILIKHNKDRVLVLIIPK
jgi:hypothetical protein